jgi:transposase
MPKKINFTLEEQELAIITKAVKSDPRAEVKYRANVIRLLHLKKTPAEIAEFLAIGIGSVYGWHKRWREGGLEGLANQPKSGRPKLGTDEYCVKLEAIIETDPTKLGYGFTIWTAARLIEHLGQETGIWMSEDTFRDLLKDRGYVYRRPKHDLKALQDKEAKQEAQEMLEMLKKKPQAKKSNYSLWTKPA